MWVDLFLCSFSEGFTLPSAVWRERLKNSWLIVDSVCCESNRLAHKLVCLHANTRPVPWIHWSNADQCHTALCSWFIEAIHNLATEHRPVIVDLRRGVWSWTQEVCLLITICWERGNQCSRWRLVFFTSGHWSPASINTTLWNEPRLHTAMRQ